MKYCPHCQQWNHGRPMRCRYCGRTWNAKLCPAGHLNPVNANFCGECGNTNLSEPAGRSPLVIRMFKYLKYIFYFYLIFIGFLIILELFQVPIRENHISLLISIVILSLGLNFALQKFKVSFGFSGKSIFKIIIKFIRWVFSSGDR